MASIKVRTIVPAVKALQEVTLVMSDDEALTLAAILRRVGGDPSRTARRHADAIYRALDHAGFAGESNDDGDAAGSPLFKDSTSPRASLYFARDLIGEVR